MRKNQIQTNIVLRDETSPNAIQQSSKFLFEGVNMSEVNVNGEQHTNTESQERPERKRRRGRPKGSKNRPKFGMSPTPRGTREEGWTDNAGKVFGKPRSLASHRKWQREWVLPQFVLSRKQAQDMLVKYLRSKPGKPALTAVVMAGFPGLSNLPDNKLGEFLVSTSLLSRYPHEIVIRGA